MVKRLNAIKNFHIGTQKAGSTYLYNLLSDHHEAGLPQEKEVNFFNTNYDKGLDWYLEQFEENSVIARSGGTKQSREHGTGSPRSLSVARDDSSDGTGFLSASADRNDSGGGTGLRPANSADRRSARNDSGGGTGLPRRSTPRNDRGVETGFHSVNSADRQSARDGRVLIDTSPKYFMQGEAVAPRIREYADKHLNEEPKFLLILRNPVDYLYSHFKMHWKHGFFHDNPDKYPEVPADIIEFVKLYPEYLERAKYYKILKEYWLSHFDLKQFKIVIFESFVAKETGSGVETRLPRSARNDSGAKTGSPVSLRGAERRDNPGNGAKNTRLLSANSADRRFARNDSGDNLPEILDWFGLSQKELRAARTSRNAMLKYNVLFDVQKKIVKHKRLKEKLKRSKLFNYIYDRFLTQKEDERLTAEQRALLWEHFEGDVSGLETLLGREMWG